MLHAATFAVNPPFSLGLALASLGPFALFPTVATAVRQEAWWQHGSGCSGGSSAEAVVAAWRQLGSGGGASGSRGGGGGGRGGVRAAEVAAAR